MLVSQLFPWIPNHIHIQSTCPVPLFHANGLAEAKTNLQPHPAPLTYQPSCCVMPHLPHFLSLHISKQTHRALFFFYLQSAWKQEWPNPTGCLLDYNDTAPLTSELCRPLPSVAIAHGSSCPEVITTHSLRSRSLGLLAHVNFSFSLSSFPTLTHSSFLASVMPGHSSWVPAEFPSQSLCPGCFCQEGYFSSASCHELSSSLASPSMTTP